MIKFQGIALLGDELVNTVGNLSSYNALNSGIGIVPGSLPACTVTIYLTGTITLATIYSDNNGTIKANPFTADLAGHWFFYAPTGHYDAQFSPASPPNPPFTSFTWSDLSGVDATLGGGGGAIVNVPFATGMTFNAAQGSIFQTTLTGNVTGSSITNPTTSQVIAFSISQDGAGSHTFAWPANVLGAPAISSAASVTTNTQMYFDGTNWRTTGFELGGITLPTSSDTMVGRSTTDILTGKTLNQTLAVQTDNTFDLGTTSARWRNLFISGTIQTTASTMGLTFKKGSGGGNYTTSSTSYVAVDNTNLTATITVPTGWKLLVAASGAAFVSTASVNVSMSLIEGVTVYTETIATPTTAALTNLPFSLLYVLTGDGNPHTIFLAFKTANGADAAGIQNGTATLSPTMVYLLIPSN